jgi:2-polyprenyl-6-methoxyphenol hydroxylase-like FAD-dependent oxidoreductase
MTSEVPVLIVGGGAVGSVLSMELARRGIEYRCIDRMPGPSRESRAIAMHARTVELMDLVDAELGRELRDRSLSCKGYVMHFLRDGERTEVRPGLDYTTVDSRYNCIFAHNQSVTQGVIAEYTHTRFGTSIEYNTTFHDLTQDADGVTARVTHADRGDEEELIRCQYLVAGDGINSRVRRGLGLPVKGKDYAGSFFQNLDVHLHGFTDWTDYFHYCVGTDHFLMVAPLPGGAFRLLLSDRGEAADPSLTPQQAFMRLLERHYDGITMGDVV